MLTPIHEYYMARKKGDTKHRTDKDFIRKPTFEGGSKAMNEFISTHLVYPETALRQRIQGDVQVKFDVSEHGDVIAARIARGIGFGCDEEALRVVKMLKYTPARNRKVHVTTHHDLVIHFRLPNVQAPVFRQSVTMNYTFVPASAEETLPEETPGVPVFTWTVQRKPN